MDQGVLVSLKRRYRRKILEKLVFQERNGASVVDFLRGIHLLKVSEMIAASWNEIQPKTLRLSWRKILPLDIQDEDSAEPPDDSHAVEEEFQPLFEMLDQELEGGEISEWLQADTSDRGYEHLSDAEIITEVTSELTEDNSDDVATEEEGASSCTFDSISHAEAVKMFDSCINWLQLQSEASPHNLSVLHNLREIAAQKRLSSVKQRPLTDYF